VGSDAQRSEKDRGQMTEGGGRKSEISLRPIGAYAPVGGHPVEFPEASGSTGQARQAQTDTDILAESTCGGPKKRHRFAKER